MPHGPEHLLLAHGDAGLPPLTLESIGTTWHLYPSVVLLLAAAAISYLWASHLLRRRGVRWNWRKDLSWLAGLALIGVSTCGVIGVYDTTLFSAHAVQHMGLQMFAPVWLALATPITLVLRVLRGRGRKRLTRLLHSSAARVVTHPLVTFALFGLSPFVLYYSPLYEYTLRHDWAHDLSHVHFVGVGLLMYTVVLGSEPLPRQLPFVFRFTLIPATGISHVLLGVPIMTGKLLFAADFYRDTTQATVAQLVNDQQLGGALLWTLGDLTMLSFLVGFIPQWVRADQREARRVDRNLDRIHGHQATTLPRRQRP
jgi:cytochrome c oxidase assembly factor CtaG